VGKLKYLEYLKYLALGVPIWILGMEICVGKLVFSRVVLGLVVNVWLVFLQIEVEGW
jgi:hypothetical protein